MSVVAITILIGCFFALSHGVWHLKKYPKILENPEEKPDIIRVFIGSSVGIFVGFFLLFIFQDRGVESNKKDILLGSFTLFICGVGLLIYSKELMKNSIFGDANKFLGVSYAILASIFLVNAVLFCILPYVNP